MTIFEDLIPDPIPAGVKVLYGTVTGSSPLRVQVDTDPGPLPITPVTTVACTVGDRVVILSHVRADDPQSRARAYVIVGVIGGPQWPVHLCEVTLSESGTAAEMQTVNMAISSQSGGFALSSDTLLLPAAGLWHASLFVDTGTRPTSFTTRHFVQMLLNGSEFNRQDIIAEDFAGTSSDFRAASGDAVKVEWYPAVTTSLTGNLIVRYIAP